jgi:hAT family C-terminal dimerisation region
VQVIEENSSLAAQMQKSIASVTLPPSKKADPFLQLQKELKLYEATGVRTPNLTKLDNGLKTIQPTSTASERTFSVAGNFSTKLRNRMKFPMLNALIFLNIIF